MVWSVYIPSIDGNEGVWGGVGPAPQVKDVATIREEIPSNTTIEGDVIL
jgi:hypothetical protein